MGFTAICWVWRYCLRNNRKNSSNEQSVGGESIIFYQTPTDTLQSQVGHAGTIFMIPNDVNDTTIVATLTFSLQLLVLPLINEQIQHIYVIPGNTLRT